MAAPTKAILEVACLEARIAAATGTSPASHQCRRTAGARRKIASAVGQNRKVMAVMLRLIRYDWRKTIHPSSRIMSRGFGRSAGTSDIKVRWIHCRLKISKNSTAPPITKPTQSPIAIARSTSASLSGNVLQVKYSARTNRKNKASVTCAIAGLSDQDAFSVR